MNFSLSVTSASTFPCFQVTDKLFKDLFGFLGNLYCSTVLPELFSVCFFAGKYK